MHWSLRTSFTDYVASIDDSKITHTDVTVDSSARLVFDGVAATDGAAFRFAGSVHFWAHFGVMDFLLGGIEIHLDGTPRITIGPQPRREGRVTIAELVGPADVTDSAVTLGARLTEGGVKVLGDVYSVGAELDPIQIVRSRPEN